LTLYKFELKLLIIKKKIKKLNRKLKIVWGYSSVGRASALQAEGQEFEPPYLHHPQNLMSPLNLEFKL